MKILVADDDRLDRKLLSACLEKAGYAVQLVEDGIAALRALVQPDAPQIALLDWSMPGISGLEVCTKLRSVKLPVRPYLIMITAKTDKPDIANALDGGADDFVTKPFNSGELLARIRVARRTIQYQADLRQQLRAFESLATRYNLLGEIAAIHEPAADPAAPASTAVPTGASALAAAVHGDPLPAGAAGLTGSPPAFAPDTGGAVVLEAVEPEVPPGVLPTAQLADLFVRFVQERGISPVTYQPGGDASFPAARVTAWAGFILGRERVWIDVLLEAELASATCVFAHFLSQRPGSAGDLGSFLAEAHTIFSAMYKTALQDAGHEVLTPFLSHARMQKTALLPCEAGETDQVLHFDANGAHLGLTIRQRRCKPRLKGAGQVSRGDVMAEPFPQGIAETPPFLARGVVMTDRFIGRLSAYDDATTRANTVPVFVPTDLARQFLDLSR